MEEREGREKETERGGYEKKSRRTSKKDRRTHKEGSSKGRKQLIEKKEKKLAVKRKCRGTKLGSISLKEEQSQ